MNKNNILLLIIIILIVILISYGYFIFFKLNNEGFQTIKQNMDNSIHKCKFFPWGPTLESCRKNCMNDQRVGLWDKSGKDCTEDICSEICGLCTFEPACQWISSWSNIEKEKMLKIKKEDTVLSKLVPKKLSIVGISFPESELSVQNSYVNITVSWTNYGDSKAFMIHFYDMKENGNMIKVETLENGNAEEYNLSGLNANSKYSVIVYALNEYGVSNGSNIILVET
jgi:hypothetical protein